METLELAGQDAKPAAALPQYQLSAVEHAIRSGATPEQLERVLELQVRADNHKLEMMREKRRMDDDDRKSAALLAYRRDVSGFRGENIIIAKDKHVDRGRAGSFMQAEYHSVAKMLSPALSKHGFSFRHDQKFGPKPWPLADNPANVVGWVWVTCFLEHKDGHAETLELEGPEGDQSANTPVQNMQLTASYLKRQSLLAITGTATGGEDDENKMRGDLHGDETPSAAAALPADVLAAGRAAAALGMAELSKWFGAIGADLRTACAPYSRELKSAAKQADAARTVEEPPVDDFVAQMDAAEVAQ